MCFLEVECQLAVKPIGCCGSVPDCQCLLQSRFFLSHFRERIRIIMHICWKLYASSPKSRLCECAKKRSLPFSTADELLHFRLVSFFQPLIPACVQRSTLAILYQLFFHQKKKRGSVGLCLSILLTFSAYNPHSSKHIFLLKTISFDIESIRCQQFSHHVLIRFLRSTSFTSHLQLATSTIGLPWSVSYLIRHLHLILHIVASFLPLNDLYHSIRTLSNWSFLQLLARLLFVCSGPPAVCAHDHSLWCLHVFDFHLFRYCST